jgi:ribose transport system permease protein
MAITAVVVGGTALSGGEGGVLQTLVGVLIVAVLLNGMVLMGISPSIQQAVQGLMIIIAVAISIDRKRLRIVK